MLGVSAPVYVVASLLAILGGIGAGFDHLGAGEGAVRGAVGGLLFGVAIVATHALAGNDAKTSIPHPAIVLAIVTAILGALLGALGGALRARVEARKPQQRMTSV
jgi:uncharacterized membrane protein